MPLRNPRTDEVGKAGDRPVERLAEVPTSVNGAYRPRRDPVPRSTCCESWWLVVETLCRPPDEPSRAPRAFFTSVQLPRHPADADALELIGEASRLVVQLTEM